jgi:hypothetical protein
MVFASLDISQYRSLGELEMLWVKLDTLYENLEDG